MNVWVIALIVLVIAMVVGPVMMFKPNRRDSYLAELRQSAAQKGVRVRLVDLEVNAIKQTLTEYSLPYSEKRKDNQSWMLIKQGMVHDVHFFGQWDWQNKKHPAPQALYPWVKSQAKGLPASIYGFGATSAGVCLLWQERELSIDDIVDKLEEIRQKLQDG